MDNDVCYVGNLRSLQTIPCDPMSTPAQDQDRERAKPVVALVCAGQGLSAALGANFTELDWHTIDPTDLDLVEKFAQVDVVIHAWIDPDLSAVDPFRGDLSSALTAKVLAACNAANVQRLVMISSAMVYGASSLNEVPLPDEAPLRANGTVGVLQDLLDAEEQIARWGSEHKTAVSIVRPAIVFGPNIDTAFLRHFESPRLLFLKGSTPAWQFVHVVDVATAIEVVITNGINGVVPVGADGWLSQEEVEAVSGIRRLELPATAVMSTAERLHHHGVSPAPAEELDFIRYPWVIDAAKLRAQGWRPTWTNEQILQALMRQAQGRTAIAGRRVGRSEVTALTAAAAVLTAAALVRARRRRSL
jgi:nucleoside-diphosphate-sugar epimerase